MAVKSTYKSVPTEYMSANNGNPGRDGMNIFIIFIILLVREVFPGGTTYSTRGLFTEGLIIFSFSTSEFIFDPFHSPNKVSKRDVGMTNMSIIRRGQSGHENHKIFLLRRAC